MTYFYRLTYLDGKTYRIIAKSFATALNAAPRPDELRSIVRGGRTNKIDTTA